MGLTKLLFVVASVVIIAVVMVLSLNAILHRPIKLRNSVSFLINESALISINAPIYVVGPQSLVQELIGVGVNQSLIRPVSLSELPYLPGDSLVIIDWSFIKPGLLVNEDGIVSVNVDSMVFKFVEGLVRRGDFVIIHGNSSDIPIIEYALALAWSRAFNTSIIAMPIPKYLSNLNYVVAFGNDRVLVIGPHTLTSALEIANNLWLPIIMKGQVVNLTDDLCTELVQEYESLMANQSVIQYMAYAIIYGEQNYNGPFGTASVDFCMSWMPIIDQDYNGHVVGYAQFYDYIRYISSPAVTINYLGVLPGCLRIVHHL
ncbi:hypothetical protein [Vulcanisaeta distributa]|uniref:hypothetical protein n=1 Tax=Vulcanisaeta distributa TaxID=164451 RepID=UPI000AA58CF8|nr:hypothetical protein [Vulcanisaeta distributa]